jgi:hypothetical protein
LRRKGKSKKVQQKKRVPTEKGNGKSSKVTSKPRHTLIKKGTTKVLRRNVLEAVLMVVPEPIREPSLEILQNSNYRTFEGLNF